MVSRTLEITIEMTSVNEAEVSLCEYETGDCTSKTFRKDPDDYSDFCQWLCEEVEGWIDMMSEEISEGVEE